MGLCALTGIVGKLKPHLDPVGGSEWPGRAPQERGRRALPGRHVKLVESAGNGAVAREDGSAP